MGWIAKLKDGTVVNETTGTIWSSIKDDVIWLGIEVNGKLVISLPEHQTSYIQGKTASCGPFGGKIAIESRWIGFESPSGSIIKVKIMEADGLIELEES